MDSSHILHPVSLIVSNLSSYGTFVTTKRPTPVHCSYVNKLPTVFAFNENIPFNIFFPLRFKYQNCIVTEVKRPLHSSISLPVYVRVFFCALMYSSLAHRQTDRHTHSDMLFSSDVS